MDILKLTCIENLTKQYRNVFKGMAFDGNYYYLGVPNQKLIYVLDQKFKQVKYQKVNRGYSVLSYDDKNHCFFAADTRSNTLVYKLDKDLNEVHCISVAKPMESASKIIGLTCNTNNHSLVVAYEDIIIDVNENGQVLHVIQDTSLQGYSAIQTIYPYYIAVGYASKQQFLCIYNNDNYVIKKYLIPDEYVIDDITLLLDHQCQCFDFIILATNKSCQSCLLSCVIDIDCNETCSCCIPCCNIACKEQCICDLIESIALQETALAHILNAEGEKLQKAISQSRSICELLEIDACVNKTITNVTVLENLLYTKLLAVLDLSSCDKKYC